MDKNEIHQLAELLKETKPKEKGVFITWKHLGLIITVLGMAAAGYYNVRTAVENQSVLDDRQTKYNSRFWEFKKTTEDALWTLREDYWEREHGKIKTVTEMQKDIEYLKKHDHD